MANITDIAECFLYLDESNGGDGISNLKLQKLMYYAQGFHSALFDNALFDHNIEAWAHGPVIPELYHVYKKYGRDHIPVPSDFDISKITTEEFDLVQEVFEVFGQYSAWKLRNMTHEETPWLNHEGSAGIIPLDELTEYFKTRIVN